MIFLFKLFDLYYAAFACVCNYFIVFVYYFNEMFYNFNSSIIFSLPILTMYSYFNDIIFIVSYSFYDKYSLFFLCTVYFSCYNISILFFNWRMPTRRIYNYLIFSSLSFYCFLSDEMLYNLFLSIYTRVCYSSFWVFDSDCLSENICFY